MSRRHTVLASLVLCGVSAVATAGLASATPMLPPPQPCPTPVLFYQSNGHDYVQVPDPTGQSCAITVELPVTLPPM